MKVIIAGGRDYNDYEMVKSVCNCCGLFDISTEVISGRCSDKKNGVHTFTTDDGKMVYGADGLGERYAKEYGLRVHPFEADWSKYGNSAGPIRNNKMAMEADALVAFFDGKSKGTGNMIKTAKAKGLLIFVENI